MLIDACFFWYTMVQKRWLLLNYVAGCPVDVLSYKEESNVGKRNIDTVKLSFLTAPAD